MSGIDMDAIRKRAEAATPGPWGCGGMGVATDAFRGARADRAIAVTEVFKITDPEWRAERHQDQANAEFIAHAREDVPALLAALQERDERIAALEANRRLLADALECLGDVRPVPRFVAERADALRAAWTWLDEDAPSDALDRVKREAAADALNAFGTHVRTYWFFANLTPGQRTQVAENAEGRAASLRSEATS